MSSILLTGPAVEPVTLAEAKAYLRVEHDDDDDVIAALIAGARVHVEAQTRRALITQSWRLVRDAWPRRRPHRRACRRRCARSRRARLSARRLDAGDRRRSVRRRHGGGARGAVVRVRVRCRRRAASSPASSSTSTVGYGDAAADVPEPLRQAIRILVAHWYENRGLIAIGADVAVLPADASAALIAPYRVLSL